MDKCRSQKLTVVYMKQFGMEREREGGGKLTYRVGLSVAL